MEHNTLERILEGSLEPQDLRISLLENITDNFSDERIIGHGGFAIVYKGVLRNGEVAVKMIRSCKTIDEKLFRREVNNLMNVNHQNIVRFLGFCSNTMHKAIPIGEPNEYIYAEIRERILCFEYINNGSLDKYITDELRGLEWDNRYEIIKGICQGLKYLHVEKHVIHMDLKPSNILLDNQMVAKIADFGLSRLDKNTHTETSNRFLSLGYCAPEYLIGGKMSVKSDVYSLGIIMIELMTGKKGIPDKNNVLRRWRHRWHKSGGKTPFGYQQITKLIEIGIQCQETDPCRRPSISEIIHDVNELGKMDIQISNANDSPVGQINPFLADGMLGIEPLQLYFPFELNKQIPCALELTNDTNACIAFVIQQMSPLPYCTRPSKGIVQPQSKRTVSITLQPLDNAPQDKQQTTGFIVRSTNVNESLTNEDINEVIFSRLDGTVVDEVTLTVVFGNEVPKLGLSLEPLTISGTGDLKSSAESIVPPAEAESTTSLSTSNELIQLDPPQLCVPFLPNKTVPTVFLFKIINVTDYRVGFNTWVWNSNKATYYLVPRQGILPPRSTQVIKVQRRAKEKEPEDMQCRDIIGVWNGIVAEGVEVSDTSDNRIVEESMELPIALSTTSLSTSNELIQIDPPQLCVPFLPNKTVRTVFLYKIINVTDYRVGFNTWVCTTNKAIYYPEPRQGILPPRSTQVIKVKRIAMEKEPEDLQWRDIIGVWNGIVAEGVEVSDISDNRIAEESMELPIALSSTSLSTSNELIQLDPPQLCVPFLPNKTVRTVFLFKIINVTDYRVGFNTWIGPTNKAIYYLVPRRGILPPRSTQVIKVKRIAKEKEPEDMRCRDSIGVWNGIVAEGVEVSDIAGNMITGESMELPIVLSTTSLSTSNELIQFDPPQLCVPFLPNKRMRTVFLFKIINVTDYRVGFNTWIRTTNKAKYYLVPGQGILPPRSTQVIKVQRIAKEKEPEDMQCRDIIGVWNGIVGEGVEVSDISEYMFSEESKELPIVLSNPGESSSACTVM